MTSLKELYDVTVRFLPLLLLNYYLEECWSFVLFHSLFFPFLFFYWGKKKFSSSQNNVWLGTFCWIFLKPAAPWNNGVLHRTNLYRKIFIRKLSFFLCVWNNILTRFRISRSKAYFFFTNVCVCVFVYACVSLCLCVFAWCIWKTHFWVCAYLHDVFGKHVFVCVYCMSVEEFICAYECLSSSWVCKVWWWGFLSHVCVYVLLL